MRTIEDHTEEDKPLPTERRMDAPVIQKFTSISISDTHKIVNDDLEQMHFILTQVQDAWKVAFAIDDVCKLALTQAKLLEMRRNLMSFSTDVSGGGARGRINPSSPYDD